MAIQYSTPRLRRDHPAYFRNERTCLKCRQLIHQEKCKYCQMYHAVGHKDDCPWNLHEVHNATVCGIRPNHRR